MSAMTQLLDDLASRGIRLWLDAGKLRYRAPKGALDEALRNRLKEHKAALIATLKQGAVTPLAPAQRALWLADRFESNRAVYNEALVLELDGRLSLDHLQQALNAVCSRHEILRTRYPEVEGAPVAVVEATAAVRIQQVVKDDGTHVQLALNDPFNLATGPLLRAVLIGSGQHHLLVISLHHMIADAWSAAVFLAELGTNYRALAAGQTLDLTPLPRQYRDHAVAAAARDRGPALAYWQKQLAGLEPLLRLPWDYPRPTRSDGRGASVPISLSRELTGALKRSAAGLHSTLFCVLAAHFADLLGRYADSRDIAFGTTVANREHADDERLIGFFINTLVLRADLNGDPDIAAITAQMQRQMIAGLTHNVPFEQVVEAINPVRDAGATPLVQVMLVLHNAPTMGLDLPGLRVTRRATPHESARFDLTLMLHEEDGRLCGDLIYKPELFRAATMNNMAAQWTRLLAEPVTTRLSQRSFLSRPQQQNWLARAQGPRHALGRSPFHRRFEHWARQTPTAPAVIDHHGAEISYGRLNREAEALAGRLVAAGIGPETRVALHLNRSPALLVAVLAVAKAGAAWVVLDPEQPVARKQVLLDAATPQCILVQGNATDLPAGAPPTCDLDQSGPEPLTPQHQDDPRHLAYVLFTSGSTGTPKGVAIEHGALAHYLDWAVAAYSIEPGVSVPLHGPLSFDATLTSLLGPLVAGATVALFAEGDEIERLKQQLFHNHAVVKLTPAHLNLCLNENPPPQPRTRTVILGGEALHAAPLQRWREALPHAVFYNEYGPTETTVGCSVHAVQPADAIEGAVPIGSPIANTRLYVLDRFGRPTPPGIAGELYIGGAGLARGYDGQPAATAAAFVPDPFSDEPGARMYRSGDRVVYRVAADGGYGELVFLDRRGRQLKIAGYRIEPGEIEAALRRHPRIDWAGVAVIAGERPQLGVRYSYHGRSAPDAAELRAHLNQFLPHTMIPSHFAPLQEVPLTAHGKVDQHALAALPWPKPTQITAPRHAHERRLVALWADLLQRDNVGIHDNFFSLGGDSLTAVRLAARAAQQGLYLTQNDVFRYQTVAELAQRITDGASTCAAAACGTTRELEPAFGEDADAEPGRPGRLLSDLPADRRDQADARAAVVTALLRTVAVPGSYLRLDLADTPDRDLPVDLPYRTEHRHMPTACLAAVTERLQAPPCETCSRLAAQRAEAPVSFAWVDDVDAMAEPEHFDQQRLHVRAGFAANRLHVTWFYDGRHLKKQDADRYAKGFADHLKALNDQSTPARPLDPALARRNTPARVALTPMQAGMLFVDGDTGGTQTLRQACCKLQGRFDAAAFERAWSQVIQRHQPLRTTFAQDEDGQPYRLLPHRADPVWQYPTLPAGPNFQVALDDFLAADRARPFDLSQAPLMRFALIEAETPIFVWTYHQALLDGWSLPLLFRELSALYRAETEQTAPTLPQPPNYARYNDLLANADQAQARAWWQNHLAGYDGLSPAHGEQCAVNESLLQMPVAAIEALARTQGLTLFTLLSGAWALVNARYRNSNDVVFGTVSAHRPAALPDAERMIGLFIYSAPVRIRCKQGGDTRQWLQALQRQHGERQALPPVSLGTIRHWCDLPGDRRLFDNLLIVRNFPEAAAIQASDDMRLTDLRYVEHTGLPLTLVATRDGDQLNLQLQWCADVPGAGPAMLTAFTALLTAMAEQPSLPPHRLAALSAAEQQALLAPKGHAAVSGHLAELFRAQAARTPDAAALLFPADAAQRHQSYRDLAAAVDKLAARLAATAPPAEAVIGVFLPRSAELVAAVLAVLEVGGAFLLLDPDYPDARLRLMVEDARAHLLITNETLAQRRLSERVATLRVDGDGAGAAWRAVRDPAAAAYVIYTSGSSGRPKGIVAQHGAVVNRLAWMWRAFPFGENAVLCQKTALCFVDAVWELFGGLLQGVPTFYPDPACNRDPLRLLSQAEAAGVTRLTLVPSLLRVLVEDHGDLLRKTRIRTWISSGERLPADLAASWRAQVPAGTRLVNLYGSSEVSADVAVHEVLDDGPPADPLPIGRPIDGANCLILNEDGQIQPVGAPGLLHVAGAPLARAYWHDAARTAARFVPNPFPSNAADTRLFNTGDLARRNTDNSLTLLGRADDQVKIRGVRIALGELEQRLNAEDAVTACAVLALGRDEDTQLVAVVQSDKADAGRLRARLAQQLPSNMLPDRFVFLEQWPLTPNGKVDRQRLLELARRQDNERTEHPQPSQDPLSTAVAQAWSLILETAPPEPTADFFQCGGNSLKAMRLISWLRRFNQTELDVGDLFRHPRFADFAALARDRQRVSVPTTTPLTRTVGRNRFPLSTMQRRLWLLFQMEETGAAYHIHAGLDITGPLDGHRLRAAWTRLLEQHGALRTRFISGIEEPEQVLGAAADLIADPALYSEHDLTDDPQATSATQILTTARRTPFDLAARPPWRLRLLRLAPNRCHLHLTIHHLIADGWSLGVLFHDLFHHYTKPEAKAEARPDYGDYALWQRTQNHEPDRDYWGRQLAGLGPAATLVRDTPTRDHGYAGAVVVRRLDASTARALRGLCLRSGSTPFMLLEAVFAFLIGRYADSRDIAVGVPLANREPRETETMVGFFANTVVLRHQVQRNQSFTDWLQQTRTVALEAFAHGALPYEAVVAATRAERDADSPLFRVMFIMQNTPLRVPAVPDLTCTIADQPVDSAMFDLTLNVVADSDGYRLEWHNNRDLFTATHIASVATSFEHLLATVLAAPEQRLQAWQPPAAPLGTRMAYPDQATLPALFEKQVHQRGDQTALIDGDQHWSWSRLNRHANGIALRLQQLGVKPETPVAVCLQPGPSLVAALLGILKAGGAFLPLDAAYPRERLALMLDDAATPFLICDNDDLLAERKLTRLQPDTIDPYADNRNLPIHALNAATLIYTSGSSGRPKGVLGTHRATINRFAWMWRRFPFQPGERCARKTALSFVDAVWEILGPLLHGVPLVLLADERVRDAFDFVDDLAGHRVTRLLLVPSQLRFLLDSHADLATRLPHLRLWFCSGERLPRDLAEQFAAALPQARLVNLYGASEAAGDSSYAEVVVKGRVLGNGAAPIGRAIDNTSLHLDGDGTLPLGAVGEITIGGEGLARGYYRQPALTAAAFRPDPQAEMPGARRYHSGDLGRWVTGEAGQVQLHFQGRMAGRVKLRGVRIETGEIEAALKDQVTQAVVCAQDDHGETVLVAHLAGKGDGERVRATLRQRLPEVMVPRHILFHEALPLTPNGKIDRQALHSFQLPANERENAVAPRNQREQELAELWRGILHHAVDDVHANFFQLGGHSLAAMRLASAVRNQMALALPLRAVFTHPTIAEQAIYLDHQRPLEVVPALTSYGDGDAPLTFAQQRLWFLDQLEGRNASYNMPFAVVIEGDLDEAAVARTFAWLADRHLVLRTVFPSVDGVPVQRVVPGLAPSLERHDLRDQVPSDADEQHPLVRSHIQRVQRTPFDLSRDCLLRLALLRLGSKRRLLAGCLHHIIGDDWSVGVLIREFTAGYAAFSQGKPPALAPLALQFRDVAHHQQQQVPRFEETERWWRRHLADAPRLLELPTDRPRPAVQSFAGDQFFFTIDASLGCRLAQRCAEWSVTPFGVLRAVFALLLQRLSGVDDLVLGSPVAGRDWRETEGLIGFFANTLALRCDLGGNPGFADLVLREHDRLQAAFEQRDMPFERVVEALCPERDLGHAPLFQAAFILQNAPRADLHLDGMTLRFPKLHAATSKFDVSLFLSPQGAGYEAYFEYAVDLFDGDTLRRWAAYFTCLLDDALSRPACPLSHLRLAKAAPHDRFTAPAPVPPAWLPTRFAAVAAHYAEQAALVSAGGDTVSYAALEQAVNRLAARLRDSGIGSEDRIGVFLARSPAMVVACLAVARAGAAFVPLDPSLPVTRLKLILADATPRLLLCASTPPPDLAGTPHWVLDQPLREDALGAASPVPTGPVHGASAAYVLYTSGSTGRPKGVVISHDALADYLDEAVRCYRLAPACRVPLHGTFAFDATITALWAPLVAGATVCLVPEGREPEWLAEHLVDTYDLAKLTPAHLDLLAPRAAVKSARLRTLVVGGEILTPATTAPWREALPDVEIFNEYGPTEATVGCALYRVDGPAPNAARHPIGQAMRATRLLVLDDALNPCPVGVPGRLYIAGPCLARGYLGLPRLSAERFRPNPYAVADWDARMYDSGDRARVLADGNLEVLGRLDDQLKIRGYRIEPDEIAAWLRDQPGVGEAQVLAHGEGNDRRLAAYLTRTDADSGATEANLADWRQVFDSTYQQTVADPHLNLLGWTDSFTGLPIGEAAMREWVDAGVARIAAHQPRRILEIGCGNGLLLFRLAAHCARYVAADLSQQALNHVAEHLDDTLRDRVQLHHCAADALPDFAEQFDCIVLHSVVQYFPDIDYLTEVLRRAAGWLSPNGVIVVGDVRSLPLQRAFHSAVCLQRAPGSLRLDRLQARIRARIDDDPELVIDPAYFEAAAAEIDGLESAQTLLRRGTHPTEMNRYRYDAVLYATAPEVAGESATVWTPTTSINDLIAAAGAGVAVPNQRLQSDAALAELLAQAEAEDNVERLRRLMRAVTPSAAVDPQALWQAADDAGLTALLGPDSAPFHFRFSLNGRLPAGPASTARRFPDDYANQPTMAKQRQLWLAELRRAAKAALPTYMVPASWLVLDRFPLTANGKRDLRALPDPNLAAAVDAQAVAPRNAVETRIAAVWEELLGRPVGVTDHFFEIGGHSLMAARILARMATQFGAACSLQTFFQQPTVAGLAAAVEADQGQPQRPPIPVGKRPARLPLAPAQLRLWFLSRFAAAENAAAYHISFALRLRGALDLAALEAALNAVATRHESLRTRFVVVDEQPCQIIDSVAAIRLNLMTDADDGHINEAARRPFDLAEAPPHRFQLIRESDRQHLLIAVFHHLIFDGWSVAVFADELAAAYDRERAGNPHPAPPTLQYADYALWRQAQQTAETLADQIQTWLMRLTAYPTQISLPFDHARPATPSYRAEVHAFTVPAATCAALDQRGTLSGTTRFMTLQAVLALWLQRHGAGSRFLIGTPAAGRNHADLERQIGFFVNTLVLRCDLSGHPTFESLLQRTRVIALEAFEQGDLPFERLVEALQPQRDSQRTPLFQVMFALENAPAATVRLGDLELEPVPLPQTGVKFDLTLSFQEEGGLMVGRWIYDTDLFTAATVARFADRYLALLEACLAEPTRPLHKLTPQLPELRVPPCSRSAAPRQTPLELLADHADEHTLAPALIELDENGHVVHALSYLDIYFGVLHLGTLLQERGIGAEQPVAVDAGRGAASLIAMLSILDIGAVYVPLEPAWPAARLKAVLAATRPVLIINRTDTTLCVTDHGIPTLTLAPDGEPPPLGVKPRPAKTLTRSAAVMMPTSGTSGRPKVVVVERETLFRHATRFSQTHLRRDDRVLQYASLGFDPALEQILGTIAAGACLVQRSDAPWGVAELQRTLDEQQVTVANLPTALWRAWQEHHPAPASLRLLWVGGEAMPAAYAQRAAATPALYNVYGPTEATVTATAYRVPQEPHAQAGFGRVPIGHALPGRQAYVLDDHGRLQLVGVPGRLFLGGEGLARGYRDQPRATAAAFVPDPFSGRAGARLYDTGDLAQRDADGTITLLGRADGQIKRRGYRLECGEIEHVLAGHAAVADALVGEFKQDADRRDLVAWLRLKPHATMPTTTELHAFLAQQLPAYMIPTAFAEVADWPRNANGKINRNALPRPDQVAVTEHVPPRNPREAFLCDLWADLLQQETVGIHDDFFALGGHSLLATRVVSRLQHQYQIEPPLRVLFENPTVAQLAAWLSAVTATRTLSATDTDPDDPEREEIEL